MRLYSVHSTLFYIFITLFNQTFVSIPCSRSFENRYIHAYTQRLQKLIFLYLSTGCFVEFSVLSSGLSIHDFSTVFHTISGRAVLVGL